MRIERNLAAITLLKELTDAFSRIAPMLLRDVFTARPPISPREPAELSPGG